MVTKTPNSLGHDHLLPLDHPGDNPRSQHRGNQLQLPNMPPVHRALANGDTHSHISWTKQILKMLNIVIVLSFVSGVGRKHIYSKNVPATMVRLSPDVGFTDYFTGPTNASKTPFLTIPSQFLPQKTDHAPSIIYIYYLS